MNLLINNAVAEKTAADIKAINHDGHVEYIATRQSDGKAVAVDVSTELHHATSADGLANVIAKDINKMFDSLKSTKGGK